MEFNKASILTNSPLVDVYLHWDRLSYPEPTIYLLLLLNATGLAEKQHFPILKSLVWPNRCSNPRYTTLESVLYDTKWWQDNVSYTSKIIKKRLLNKAKGNRNIFFCLNNFKCFSRCDRLNLVKILSSRRLIVHTK